MNFLGMGPMELFLVLMVAFIFLGPERMVDAARLLGKAVREARRMAADLPRLDLEEDVVPADARGKSTSGAGTAPDARRESMPPGGPADEGSESSGAADSPVAFQRKSEASGEGGDEPSAQGERP